MVAASQMIIYNEAMDRSKVNIKCIRDHQGACLKCIEIEMYHGNMSKSPQEFARKLFSSASGLGFKRCNYVYFADYCRYLQIRT